MPSVGPDHRYRLLRCLGRGGMGEVHLAVARGAAGFEKLVAVKFLEDTAQRDRTQTKALLREAFLGVHLDHENIVQVLDLGEDDDRYFVVMEYVRGFTLAHVLAHLDTIGQSMPVGAALHVARAVLDALGYLHRLRGPDNKPLGLIHGDVSPSNVLLAGDGRVKLSDFGVASFGGESSDEGTVAGKLSYLPPEAFAGAPRTQRWDVYAAAAMLYEAIAGVPAFPGTSLDAIRNALRRGAPPLSAHRPDVPRALAQAIEGALAFHAERRPAGIPELRASIEEAAPRDMADVDTHRTLVAATYGDDRFVQEHGELPTVPGQPDKPHTEITTTAVGAKTVGRKRARALRFGVSPAIGAQQARVVADRFTTFLKDRLDHEVRPVVLADYAMLVSCLVQGEIDLAWMPPTAFVSAAEHGAGVLAKIRRAGQTTYESALIARAERGVRTLEELRGKAVAWVDRDSASGYLFAFAALRDALGGDPDALLGEQHFGGSHRAVCEAVAKGWADAGATYASRDADGNVLSSGWRDTLGERASLVTPIWFSPPIPGDSIAHRPFLPDALARKVADALFALDDSEEGRALLAEVFNAQGFIPAQISDYDGVREALER